jgi:hypothetical protein
VLALDSAEVSDRKLSTAPYSYISLKTLLNAAGQVEKYCGYVRGGDSAAARPEKDCLHASSDVTLGRVKIESMADGNFQLRAGRTVRCGSIRLQAFQEPL